MRFDRDWKSIVTQGMRSRALRIALAYAVVATIWILLSDRLIALLFDDPQTVLRVSTYKGVGFVLVTAALLLGLLRFTYGSLEHSHAEQARTESWLRASERRYHEVLEGILEGCQVLDFQWRYLYLNPAVERHNRRPNSELLGRVFTEAWPGIEQTHPHALMRRCMDERVPFHEEIAFTFPDGSSGWFDLRGFPVPEGIVVLSIELTEQRRAEIALRSVNESLEQTVAARTEDLRAALLRAENADRVKSAFLATMSHELRTPLNSIIGFTALVSRGLAGPVNEEQSRQLGMVAGSARHLLDLINDVLDLSKIEAGQLTVRRESFDPGEVVARVIATLAPMAEKRGLALSLQCPPQLPTMTADRRRVEQILLNLVNNALKFTERGSVRVRVEALDREVVRPGTAALPALRFSIIDTGIGIPGEAVDSVFDPFHQIDSGLARHHEGSGLGLAICRRLASLMDGRIDLRSTEGVGSEFVLVLPQRGEYEP
ncbi:MAG: PAS domain-containing protein [Rhodanobacteraceae bacterium]|nr:PAS domain-containing protein [Rhodanobacteraceae bacterium]MBL0040475.1 PAS domain-containing protein [Xanthomonadales bacterium]